MKKVKQWWKKATLNEKLMYTLITALAIGIATRWSYVIKEAGDAFISRF